jgi:Holliday junction resolvase
MLMRRVRNTVKKGTAWELAVKKHLEEDDCWFVRRAPKSAFPDLVAIDWCNKMAIECKTKKGMVTKEEKDGLQRLKDTFNIDGYIAYPKYGPSSKKLGNVIFEKVTE